MLPTVSDFSLSPQSYISNKNSSDGSDVVSVSCFGVRVSVVFHFMFVHYSGSDVVSVSCFGVRVSVVFHFMFVHYSGSDVVSVSCFGVRVSVVFHFMFVHYTFSSVCIAEWPPSGK